MGRPYTVKVKASYSLEKILTQLRHKVVNLILRSKVESVRAIKKWVGRTLMKLKQKMENV